MKKKIAILGSTGSIGISTLNIIKKDKKNFRIVLLSTNINAEKLFNQAKQFNVKNVIIANNQKYLKWKKKFLQKKINVFKNFDKFDKFFKKKIDYTIIGISGISGLVPTLKIIKHSKKIAIANKESIICGWNLINTQLKKHKSQFIPVDSEHFSIFKLIESKTFDQIKKVIITASGGPFLNRKIHKNIKISEVLNHPNWNMGKKITVDSSTLMNKVFEVVEAKKIFNLCLNQIDILINPNSYIHACIILNDGTVEMLAHETNMEIPIMNSIYNKKNLKYKTKEININKINNLNFSMPDTKKFKALNILKYIPKKDSLFETILISVNDELVNHFLKGNIKYYQLIFDLLKIIKFKIFKKYYKIKPNSVKQILNVQNLAIKVVNEYVKKNY